MKKFDKILEKLFPQIQIQAKKYAKSSRLEYEDIAAEMLIAMVKAARSEAIKKLDDEDLIKKYLFRAAQSGFFGFSNKTKRESKFEIIKKSIPLYNLKCPEEELLQKSIAPLQQKFLDIANQIRPFIEARGKLYGVREFSQKHLLRDLRKITKAYPYKKDRELIEKLKEIVEGIDE